MAYVTLANFKLYITELNGTQSSFTSADDTALQVYLDQAVAEINRSTARSFEASASTAKTYSYDDYEGQVLLLGDDCLTVTAVVNGDGVTISSTNYTLLPRNKTPKYAIELHTGYTWSTTADISITGTWGYTTTAGAEVQRVVYRLAYFYWQKRLSTGETQLVNEGVIQSAMEYPADVREWLRAMRRRDYL